MLEPLRQAAIGVLVPLALSMVPAACGSDTTGTIVQPPVGPSPGSGGDVALVPNALVAGQQHTCGLTSGGAAYCWGWNKDGQLGSVTNSGTFAVNDPVPTPQPVSGNLTLATLAAERPAIPHVDSAGADCTSSGG
jgi:alpha-tubulin suppressor-like RCC1 family protein